MKIVRPLPGVVREYCCLFLILLIGCARHGDIQALKHKAEQGDAQVQYDLGKAYHRGKGVEPDTQEAAKWYLKAASQGHPGAQFEVGMLILAGDGVDQDMVEAYKWVSLAAQHGNSNALYNLKIFNRKMTAGQIAQGQKLAESFTPSSRGSAQ